MLAARATRIAVSPTMKVAAEAMALKAKGVDVVDLGAGEPDFPTPKHIGDAAKAAIDANFTKYTTNSGTDELKKAIVWRYKTDYGVDYATNEVIVTAGGKQALYNAVMVLFGEGDEVITHMPGWPTLVEQIKLADATPVIVHTRPENGFSLLAQTFLDAVTPKTRGIIINSPGNPTGALMSEEELTILANGVLVSETANRDGTKTARWKLDERCPSYLCCLAVGRFVRHDEEPVGGRPVAYFGTERFTREQLARTFGRTPAMLRWIEDKLKSPFPYPKYFRIAVPEIGGAMENISLVTWDDTVILDEELASDTAERDSWLEELRARGLLSDVSRSSDDDDVHQVVRALHRYLTLSPAHLLCMSLADAVGDRRTQNQPGTHREYPNWRVPLSGPDGTPILVEDLATNQRAQRLAAGLRPSRQAT